MSSAIEQIDLLSVGIDIGSSTSHLVFSNLVLQKSERSMSKRYEVVDRQILYEGRIINTPLIDRTTIDVKALSVFFKEEYERAGFKPENIQTGAVIITGETAKKENAREILEAISEDAGKFVSATAGPNFESLIAALGSGMTARSRDLEKTILTVDIGGGTSNLAISRNGEIISTSCISVGGRLLGIDNHNVIWRIDEPALKVLEALGIKKNIGDKITDAELDAIALQFAQSLIEIMSGPAKSELTKQLMMTPDMIFPEQIDEISFSGGVSEFIYNSTISEKFDDMGHILAQKILSLVSQLKGQMIEPSNKIRATVIGAGAYSLSISGSTCFLDPELDFPIKNVPVIRVDADRNQLSIEHMQEMVSRAFERFDIVEGNELAALYFKDPVRASYDKLKLFAMSIESSLINSIKNRIPIILIFERDIANSVGNIIRRETSIKDNLLTLDELTLQDGDWIDVGSPLINGQVFPVTVKSLVFNRN